MDNQQAKAQFDLGFLIGLIEGEGTITLNQQNLRRYKLQPYIGIANTNRMLIDRVIDVCRSLSLPHYVHSAKIKSGKSCYTVQAHGLGRCKRWLDVITSHLVGKRPQAELLLEFINIRKRALVDLPWAKAYGERELEIKCELHDLNVKGRRTGNASETARRMLRELRACSIRYSPTALGN